MPRSRTKRATKTEQPSPLAPATAHNSEIKTDAQHTVRRFIEPVLSGGRIHILCHNDADGLAAGVILHRALTPLGASITTRIIGKGENAWSADVRRELAAVSMDALIVTDLGSRETSIRAGIPTLIIDHHRPMGTPPGAEMISGYGHEPTPTSGLLAFWCAEALGDAESAQDLLWIAAISFLSDLGERAPFDELRAAKARYKTAVLREVTSLVNAPRRASSGDASVAWAMLLEAASPGAFLQSPHVARLQPAREEVAAAMDEAKRAAPKFSGNVAVIRVHTPCQVHPLIAQIWRTRLPKYIVISANTGYRPGYVHFSARSTGETNLLDFLRAHAPDEADESYGGGHDQANGGSPLRLGFPVKVLGQSGLKSNDARRWQNNPHLRVSLEHLHQIFDYLQRHDIRMYRMSSDLAPYATHPAMPQFHGMVRECRSELAAIGARARELDLRLSFHPSQFIVLNSPDVALVKKSVADLASQAEMLDCMGLGPEAVVVVHVGGTYGDRAASVRRWIKTWPKLPQHVRRRLVLENDDLRFSAADVLTIHESTGVPLIFDHQHFWCFNPEGLELRPTVERMLRSWPDGVRPKIHFSTPRAEMRELKRRNRKTGKTETVYQAPVWTGHADFVNPFEFSTFMRTAADLVFDVMLEGKSKDLALIRVRTDLVRYAPDVAARFGLMSDAFPVLETDERFVLEEEPED